MIDEDEIAKQNAEYEEQSRAANNVGLRFKAEFDTKISKVTPVSFNIGEPVLKEVEQKKSKIEDWDKTIEKWKKQKK